VGDSPPVGSDHVGGGVHRAPNGCEDRAVASEKVDPLHQFAIVKILPIKVGGLDLSFTNSALFMVLTVAAITLFATWATTSRALVPGRAQSVAEMLYEFVATTLRNAAGQEGMKFFPLVFSLFSFVLFANLFGMVPYFFTVTSHIIVTFALAMVVILTVVGYGIWRHGLHFFGLFVPHGVPMALIPLVTAIEVISFLSRPISLSVRLFANMLAGHITLKVFAGFVFSLGALGGIGVVGSLLPLAMTIALTALEFLVAFLQAYVFTVLTCMYLNDAVHPGH
jgi:F-type H+-transporting ATPase subunit a